MFDPINMGMMVGGGLLSGIGGMMGAGQQADAARSAGNQSGMLNAIAMMQAQQRFSEAQGLMKPYISGGADAFSLLMKYLQGGANGIGGGGNSLMSTFAPTMQQLEQTPGYQFVRNQNLKAVQNSAAARGLGSSGNALQGGVDYANNMASTTFQQQLQNYMAQNQQAYNMLFGPTQMGANTAAANLQGVNNFNSAMLGAANNTGSAFGAGTMGAANAMSNGYNSLFGGVGGGLMNLGYNNLLNLGTQGPAFQNAPKA